MSVLVDQVTSSANRSLKNQKLSLILTGGGSRGAYQIGVLKALVEICVKEKITWPFQIMIGSSAGAINLAMFLSKVDWNNFEKLGDELEKEWINLSSSSIYQTKWTSVLSNGFNWMTSLAMKGKNVKRKQSLSLLDTAPLYQLLLEGLDFNKINQNIEDSPIETIAVNSLCYNDGFTNIFYNSHQKIESWSHLKRRSRKEIITLKHILASSAIPILFPPVKIKDDYYCDGSIRDYTPFSPAINLGADKVLVVGVRKAVNDNIQHKIPTTAKMINTILESLMLDSLEIDQDRVKMVNKLVASCKLDKDLRHVETKIILPSEPIIKFARQEFGTLPNSIKYLLAGLGDKNDSAELSSYIMFESKYLKKLIHLGYKDTIEKTESILNFIKG